MNKFFSPFLALRYLKPKRSFVSIITLISVLGVALGVAVLVVVISVFTGYGEQMRETILASQPHVVLTVRGNEMRYGPDVENVPEPFNEWPNLVELIDQMPEVVSVTPTVDGTAVAEYLDGERPVLIQAVELREGPARDRMQSLVIRTSPLTSETISGEATDATEPKIDQIELAGQQALIGDAFADWFGLDVGDTFTVKAANLELLNETIRRAEAAESNEEKGRIVSELTDITLPVDLDVVGIFDTGHHYIDSGTVFVPLEIGQELFKLGPEANTLNIQVQDPMAVRSSTENILRATRGIFPVNSWMDLNRKLLDAVAMERFLMYFLLSIIMVVAGFCIMNTMITVVYQKRAEIGLLKAVGASEGHIMRLFLVQGVVVGFAGVVTGLTLAFILIGLRQKIIKGVEWLMNRKTFDPEIYFLDELPAKVTTYDCTVICLGAFIACTLASLIPAWMAARLQPAEALRSE